MRKIYVIGILLCVVLFKSASADISPTFQCENEDSIYREIDATMVGECTPNKPPESVTKTVQVLACFDFQMKWQNTFLTNLHCLN